MFVTVVALEREKVIYWVTLVSLGASFYFSGIKCQDRGDNWS